MRVSLLIVLVLSRTFFAVYNLVLTLGAALGLYPLTIFSGLYRSNIPEAYLAVLLGIPGLFMGLLGTYLTNSRVRGALNAIIAAVLVAVEINFSLVASAIMARSRASIADAFRGLEYIVASSIVGSRVKRRFFA